MAIIATAPPPKPRKLIPAGTHIAVYTRCIHLGVQETTFGLKDRVRLDFEIPGERITYTDKDGVEKDGPAMIGNEYNLTLGGAKKPSTLRAIVEAWRGGKPITDQEAKSIDLAAFLGKVCMVGVVHKPSGDRVYANISGIMAAPKGIAAGIEHEGPLVEYSPDAHDDAMYALVPQWVKDTIDQRIKKEAPIAAAPRPTGPMDHPPGEPFNDEIPWDEKGVVTPNPTF